MSQTTNKIAFGTDGIRQTAGKWPLDFQGLHQIGLGIGKYLSGQSEHPRVVIGQDTRTSGDFILSALCSGLLSYGVEVTNVGVITTAGIAYLAKYYQQDIGVVISASHNPWTENGVKLIGHDGFKLPEQAEIAIEEAINSENENKSSTGFGRMMHKPEWVEAYVDHLIAPFEQQPFDKLRVVIDCSNGAASWIAPRCFERLGCETTTLHNQPDGENINRNSGSEVVREQRGDLIPEVLKQKAHFGAAFDGDADRAVFVDEAGNLVDGDYVLYIFGKHLHEKGELPGEAIVTTEMANSGLDMSLSKLGLDVVRTKVGDKYVVRELQNNGYRLGGEQSGHIILFDEDHTTGDGIFTALFLAQILLDTPEHSLNSLTANLIKLPQVIASAYVSQKPQVDDIDSFATEKKRIINGLGEHGTLNTRYSGTEPLFRVMIQGTDNHSLDEITRDALKLCRILQTNTGDANSRIEIKDCVTGAPIDISQYK